MGSQAQYLNTLLAMNQTNKVESQAHAERLRFAEMALEALRNVIKNNPGEILTLPPALLTFLECVSFEHAYFSTYVLSSFLLSGSETECIGHFKLLFSLLRVHGAGRVQQLVLEVHTFCLDQ